LIGSTEEKKKHSLKKYVIITGSQCSVGADSANGTKFPYDLSRLEIFLWWKNLPMWILKYHLA